MSPACRRRPRPRRPPPRRSRRTWRRSSPSCRRRPPRHGPTRTRSTTARSPGSSPRSRPHARSSPTGFAEAAGLPAPRRSRRQPTRHHPRRRMRPRRHLRRASARAQSALGADLDALALAHDQAGFGFEVIAAKLSGDQRAAARAAASPTVPTGSAGPASPAATARRRTRVEPRTPCPRAGRPAVAVALARTLESAVADAYANAVAAAPAGERLAFVDGLRSATAAAATWGATPVPFPGLPEQARTRPADRAR